MYTLVQVVKLALAEAALAMVLFCSLFDVHGIRAGRKWLAGLLVVLAGISSLAYFDFNYYPKFGRFMNPHDFFHYYLGAKYSREVGYYNLYPCAILADAEDNPTLSYTSYRRMENYKLEKAQNVQNPARAAAYRKPFTEARWREFTKDVRYFRNLLGKRWPNVMGDKGYNATPVWNMTARALASVVPTDNNEGMALLVCLDVMFLLAMFVMVHRAFGWRTCLFTVIFVGTCFPLSFTHIRGAFMRLDWVAALVIGMCLIKLARYKTAGVFMAYAGMARIFPVVFVFGLLAKSLCDLVVRRRFHRRYLEFFVAFGLVSIGLLALSILVDGGLNPWKDFLGKITLHNRDLSPSRVGFKYVFLMTYANTAGNWPAFEVAKMHLFTNMQVVWWLIQGIVCLVSFYLVKDLDDYETVAYSYVLAFFLFAPTFYYHVMLVVALFLFLPKLDQFPRALGAASMFLLSMLVFALLRVLPLDLTLSFILSCLLLALSLYMMALALSVALKAHHERGRCAPSEGVERRRGMPVS